MILVLFLKISKVSLLLAIYSVTYYFHVLEEFPEYPKKVDVDGVCFYPWLKTKRVLKDIISESLKNLCQGLLT